MVAGAWGGGVLQNDVGTLGSLPRAVDRSLLEHWGRERVRPPRTELVRMLLEALPPARGAGEEEEEVAAGTGRTEAAAASGAGSIRRRRPAPVAVTAETRQALADALRAYYKPGGRPDRQRMAHQASMDAAWWQGRERAMDSAAVGGAGAAGAAGAAAAVWSSAGRWR
eukprot:SAG25_NODE_189_length_12334_cov_8.994279_4_plen_168_part_00